MTARDRADLDELELQEAETSVYADSQVEDRGPATKEPTTRQAQRASSEHAEEWVRQPEDDHTEERAEIRRLELLRSEQEMDEERLARCLANPPGTCDGNAVAM